MKTELLIKVYALVLLTIFGLIIVHAPLSVGFGTFFPQYDLLIKAWKEILLVIATVFATVIIWRESSWRLLANDRILQAIGLYVALHVLSAAALLPGLLATVAGLVIDLRYVLFFVLVYICITLAPMYRKRFLQVGLVGAIIVIGFGNLQLFLPADILSYIGYGPSTIQPYLTVDKNPDFIRINSTMRGPNPLGAYVAVIVGLLAAYISRGRVDFHKPKQLFTIGALALSSLIVLWMTYSRSAAIAAAIAVLIVAVVAGRRFISRRVWIAGCIILCALGGGIFLGRDQSFVTNVILHENREGGSDVGSNDQHFESLQTGIERLLRQPTGAGVGSTGSASLMSNSPLILENQYLFIAHEVGWLGLMLFLTLLVLLFGRLWRLKSDWLSLGVLASGTGLSVIGILQPVWADDTVSIIWWGLAAIAIASGGQYVRRTTKQKATRSF